MFVTHVHGHGVRSEMKFDVAASNRSVLRVHVTELWLTAARYLYFTSLVPDFITFSHTCIHVTQQEVVEVAIAT